MFDKVDFDQKNWSVLLVDDDEDDYQLTRDLLAEISDEHIILRWAPNYEAAMNMIMSGDMDMILVDYLLDGHDGLELIRQARKYGIKAPIILVTGHSTIDLDQAALQAGASGCLDKAKMTPTRLGDAIFNALHGDPYTKHTAQTGYEGIQPHDFPFPATISLESQPVKKAALMRSRVDHFLQEMNGLLETVFTSNPTLLIAYLDVRLNFLRVNRAYSAILNLSPDDFIGKNHTLIFPEGPVESIFEKVLQTGRPYFAYAQPFPYYQTGAGGQGYWDWSIVPIKEADGRVSALVFSLSDVTAREVAGQSIADSQERLHSVLNNIPMVLWAIDRNGMITLCEGKGLEILGLKPGELVGQSMFKRLAVHPEAQESIRRTLAGEEITTISSIPEAPDEIGEINYIPQRDGQGQIVGMIGITYIITEQVHAEKQLRLYADRMAALADLSRSLAEAGSDSQKVLDILAQRTAELLGDQAVVSLFLETNGLPEPVAAFSCRPSDESISADPIQSLYAFFKGDSLAARVVRTGGPLLIPEFQTQVSLPDQTSQPALEISSLLIVPLRLRDHIIGSVGVLRTKPGRPFGGDDQEFLQNLADQATLLVSNARLFGTIQSELAERGRVEAALRASNEFMESLFESAPDAILLVDEALGIVRANQKAIEIFGYTVEELYGQPVEILIPNRFRHGHILERAEYMEHPNRLAMGDRLDLYAINRDGQEFPVDVMVSPLAGEGQRQVICVVRDIRERRRAEQALKQSEARFRAVFEASSLSIMLIGLDGRILACNPAFQEMLDLTNDQLSRLQVSELTYPQDLPVSESRFALLAGGKQDNTRIELRYYHRQGQPVWVRQTASLVRDYNGQPQFILSICENIDDHKRMQAELVEVQQRLIDSREDERLHLAQELHDGPMQDMIGMSYYLRDLQDRIPDPDGAEKLAILQSTIQQVNHVLRAICGDLRPPTLSPFGLEKTLRSHAEVFQQQHPELQLDLDLAADGQQLPERVRLALFRIYQHSLINIIRHAQASRVFIRLELDRDSVKLEIEDDGRGFQVPSGWIDLVRRGHFGLAGIAERTEAVGGQLSIQSLPGVGTRLQVVVPHSQEVSTGAQS